MFLAKHRFYYIPAPPPPPCVPFRSVPFRRGAASLQGPGQSPVPPFACWGGSPDSDSRCVVCAGAAVPGPSGRRTGGRADVGRLTVFAAQSPRRPGRPPSPAGCHSPPLPPPPKDTRPSTKTAVQRPPPRQDERVCARRTRRQRTVRDSHAGNWNGSPGREWHPSKPHGHGFA